MKEEAELKRDHVWSEMEGTNLVMRKKPLTKE